MIDIEINSESRLETRIVGNEKTPIVTIDRPIRSTSSLIDYASTTANFSSDDEFVYPGVRAELPPEYAQTLGPQLLGLISHVYNIPRSFRAHLIHQLYSLVTQRPEDLAVLQRIPHTDSRDPFYFATVHYLTAEEHAGTGFFRHRPTGYERISEDRYEPYKQAARSHMETSGIPPDKYINASDDHFELIASIEHKPNRMAIYPGNLLHSGLIDPGRDISDDPVSGRLTANLFLFFEPA